jgi:hypothetical protein
MKYICTCVKCASVGVMNEWLRFCRVFCHFVDFIVFIFFLFIEFIVSERIDAVRSQINVSQSLFNTKQN